MATSDTTMHLLHEVERLRPLIKDHAASAEANRQLSSAVYDAMHAAGLFTMLAPKAHGGLELHPVETMQVWEAVARLDASAAWNLVMNQAVAAYAAWLPAAGAQEVFRNGPPTVAGALNPPAAATRAEGAGASRDSVPLAVGATTRSGWPCRRSKWTAITRRWIRRRGSRWQHSESFCRAPPRRFSTPGTPWACAARARPTTP